MQVLTVVLLKIFILFTGHRFVKKRLFQKFIKGLFFNTLISLTMEGLLEFIVYSFLNLYTKDLTLNGEILGFVISIFCSFSSVIFLPLAILWEIITKDEA